MSSNPVNSDTSATSDRAAEPRRRYPIRNCRGEHCGKQIVFLRNEKTGALVPCDAATVEPLDEKFDRNRHVPHHSTCVDAHNFRTRK